MVSNLTFLLLVQMYSLSLLLLLFNSIISTPQLYVFIESHFGVKVVKPLGSGHFGEVVLVKQTVDETFWAVKLIPLDNDEDAYLREDRAFSSNELFDLEIAAMNTLDSSSATISPRLIHFEKKLFEKGVDEEEPSTIGVIIMEYVDGGTLEDFLDQKGDLSGIGITMENRISLAINLIENVIQMHLLGLYHHDIKAENVFLRSNSDGMTEVLLADFGLTSPPGVFPSEDDDKDVEDTLLLVSDVLLLGKGEDSDERIEVDTSSSLELVLKQLQSR